MGIANALDLTSNLHALKLSGAEPTLLNFEPYTEKEIMEIIRDRLKEVGDVVQEQAILLAAKKSAGTGDLRRALDVVR